MPRLIAENVYDKYNTSNLLFRFLVNRFIQLLADHMPDVEALNILIQELDTLLPGIVAVCS